MKSTANNARVSGLVYAVDLGKNTFQMHEFGPYGERLSQRTLSRLKFAQFFSNPGTPRGIVVMEACGSSHHWGRWLVARGYAVELLPAQFVAKQRVGNKTNGNDADAIYAVHGDRRVRPVPVKSLEQQDACAWHRLRERLVAQRTQCINQTRGLLAERGVLAAKGSGSFRALLRQVAEQPPEEVTPALQAMITLNVEQIAEIDRHIAQVECQLHGVLQASPDAQLANTVFGVGLITATAVASEYGGGVRRFSNCRQFAASIGITPGEHSSGDQRHLGPITRRGNPYLRRLLVQCAQNIVNRRGSRDDAMCLLARRLFERGKSRNTVIIAVANHLARSLYVVLKHHAPYNGYPQGDPADAAAAAHPALT